MSIETHHIEPQQSVWPTLIVRLDALENAITTLESCLEPVLPYGFSSTADDAMVNAVSPLEMQSDRVVDFSERLARIYGAVGL